MHKAILVLVGIIVINLGVIWNDTGTLLPCGVLRERIRFEAKGQGEYWGGVDVKGLPDSAFDAIIARDYGPETSGRCFNIVFRQSWGDLASALH